MTKQNNLPLKQGKKENIQEERRLILLEQLNRLEQQKQLKQQKQLERLKLSKVQRKLQ